MHAHGDHSFCPSCSFFSFFADFQRVVALNIVSSKFRTLTLSCRVFNSLNMLQRFDRGFKIYPGYIVLVDSTKLKPSGLLITVFKYTGFIS